MTTPPSGRELVPPVALAGAGQDPLFGEAANFLAQELLLFGQREIDRHFREERSRARVSKSFT